MTTALAEYHTMDDVVNGLQGLEDQFRRAGDRRCIFLTLYGTVSAEMRTRVARNEFLDNAWVYRYAVTFANLYREALVDYDSGRRDRVAKSWRLAFDAARAGNGLVLQDMLLGVNAHVNNDLPLALARISIDPDRTARYTDHAAVNAVLASVVDLATQRITALYAAGLTSMDDCAGELDEMMSMFSLRVARDSAWESAVSLSNARNTFERGVVSTMIGSRATVLARLLLAPSRNALFMDTCRRLERGSNVLEALHGLKMAVPHPQR